MNPANATDNHASARKTAVIVLLVVGAVFLVIGVIYTAVPAGSLFWPLGYIKGSTGHHALRLTASFAFGLVCLAVAWYVHHGGRAAADRAAADSAKTASPD